MAKKTIAELVIDLKIDSDEAKKSREEVEKLKKKGEEAGKSMFQAWKKSSKGLKKLRGAAKRVKSGLKKVGAAAKIAGTAIKTMSVGLGAVLAAGGALVAFVQSFAETSDEATKAATTMGVTIEEFERLSFAAKQSGAQVEHLSSGFRTFNKTLADNLKSGSGPAIDGMKTLGLAMKDLEGLSPEETIGLFGDELNKIEDLQQRSIASAKLFGEEAGPQLASLLAEGSAGIKNLGDQADTSSTKQRKGFSGLVGTLDTLKDSLGGLLADILEPLLPVITDIAERFGELFENIVGTGILDKFVELLSEVLDVVFELANELLPVIQDLMDSGAFESIKDTLKVLLPLLTALISIILPPIELIFFLLKPILALLNALLAVLGFLVEIFNQLATAVEEFFKSTKAFQWIEDRIKNLADRMDIFARSTSGAADEIGGLTQGIKDLVKVEDLSKTLKDKFGKLGAKDVVKGKEVNEEGAQVTRDNFFINEQLAKAKKSKKQGGGLTDKEKNKLTFELGVPQDLVDAAVAEGDKKNKKGGKKKVTSDVDIGEALGAFRSGKGSAADLANVAKQLSKKTPETKDIKPTVAISFFNFEQKINIRGGDPAKVTEALAEAIKDQMRKANAKAGLKLSSNLIS